MNFPFVPLLQLGDFISAFLGFFDFLPSFRFFLLEKSYSVGEELRIGLYPIWKVLDNFK